MDYGLLSGIASFGQGFLQGMDRAEDRKQKQLEREAQAYAKKSEQERNQNLKRMESASKLRDDWMKNQTTKNTQSVKEAFDKINQAPPSAAGDLSLIFGLMRMQDPQSTVREGEFATAQNTAGVPERLRGMYNRVVSGERLTPAQRADFRRTAQGIYRAQIGNQRTFDDQFRGLAERNQVPVEDVVLPLFNYDQEDEAPLAVQQRGLVRPPPMEKPAQPIMKAAKKPPGKNTAKPKTVVQGGVTYTLNEATGEYE